MPSGSVAPLPRALGAIREAAPGLLLVTDVCLCEYTDHGHCGLVKDGDVDNDPTLQLLAGEAVAHARAGADVIAPSDMMDGRVGAIRKALDAAGFAHLPIMAYAAKFASAFYGPFRDAAESAPQFGDRRSYQMDPANAEEALRDARHRLDRLLDPAPGHDEERLHELGRVDARLAHQAAERLIAAEPAGAVGGEAAHDGACIKASERGLGKRPRATRAPLQVSPGSMP